MTVYMIISVKTKRGFAKMKKDEERWEQAMKLPSEYTLYQIMVFLLVLMVILGILFDTNYN